MKPRQRFCRFSAIGRCSGPGESVIDVMDEIIGDKVDVALVFDDDSDQLLGIFTESDYIEVRIQT